MDASRVDRLVDGLVSAFEAGLDFYTKWKQKQERVNHYQKHERTSSATLRKCAVSTSLDISSHRIKATYQVGFALVGPEFSYGDATCRECLSTCLQQLEERVSLLRQNVISKYGGPVDLNELFRISESTRTRCISALAEQYSLFAANRAIPQELPIPKARAPQRLASADEPIVKVLPSHERIEFDRQTAVWSTSSGPPAFQSEPPSPPPTPKALPDDMQSTIGSTLGVPSEYGDIHRRASRQSIRPNNGVFSIFCAEAMSLQVDPARAVPSRKTCKCGYQWNPKLVGTDAENRSQNLKDDSGAVLLKDGFRMTRRFLAKSHCDQTADEGVAVGGMPAEQGKIGYGCVLCTSMGCAETYETAEMLRVHINAVHTKWQMLHDRDMT